jgi:hypothetical protein
MCDMRFISFLFPVFIGALTCNRNTVIEGSHNGAVTYGCTTLLQSIDDGNHECSKLVKGES